MVLAAHLMDTPRVFPSLSVYWLVCPPRVFPSLFPLEAFNTPILRYLIENPIVSIHRLPVHFTSVFSLFFSLFVAADTGNSHYTGAKTHLPDTQTGSVLNMLPKLFKRQEDASTFCFGQHFEMPILVNQQL